MMNYKGYTGVLEIDHEAGILFGEVIGLRDVITFQGETVEEARASFHQSVDFYLSLCAKQGKPPEKPFSGKFLIRIEPGLHRAIVEEAGSRGVSLNALVEATLSDAFAPPAEAPRPRARPRRKKATPKAPSVAPAKAGPATPPRRRVAARPAR